MKHIRILILCIAFALLTGCAPAAQDTAAYEICSASDRMFGVAISGGDFRILLFNHLGARRAGCRRLRAGRIGAVGSVHLAQKRGLVADRQGI